MISIKRAVAFVSLIETPTTLLNAELMKEDLVSHLCVFQNLFPGQHFDVQVNISLP